MKKMRIACPWEPSGQALGSSWVRQTQFHEEIQDFCRAVGLILGMNKEKPSAKKHSVHSLERLGPGIPRVGSGFLVVLNHSCDELL